MFAANVLVFEAKIMYSSNMIVFQWTALQLFNGVDDMLPYTCTVMILVLHLFVKVSVFVVVVT